MSIEEITKSVLHTVKERIASPLTGAIVLSWVGWNYKAVLVLLSTKTVEDKIIFLEYLIYDGEYPILQLAVWPFLTASLIVVVYPLFSLGGYMVWASWQKRFREVQEDLESGRLVTKEELESWRTSTSDSFGRLAREAEQKNAAIASLRESEKEKDALISSLREQVSRYASAANDGAKNASVENKNKERLLDRSYQLVFNPRSGSNGVKKMLFGPDGAILTGKNKNENRWRTTGAFLEFLTSEGAVQNRFVWHPAVDEFVATDEDELPAIKGQRLIPTSAPTLE